MLTYEELQGRLFQAENRVSELERQLGQPQCPRCLKRIGGEGVHTCTPTAQWRDLERQLAESRAQADYEREHCRHVVPLPDALRVMIDDAVAAERGACAKLCEAAGEEWVDRDPRRQHHTGAGIGALKCADLIRQRGEK